MGYEQVTTVARSVANKLKRARQQRGGRKKKKKKERRRLQGDASMVDDSRWLLTPSHRSLDSGEFKEVNTKNQQGDSLHCSLDECCNIIKSPSPQIRLSHWIPRLLYHRLPFDPSYFQQTRGPFTSHTCTHTTPPLNTNPALSLVYHLSKTCDVTDINCQSNDARGRFASISAFPPPYTTNRHI